MEVEVAILLATYNGERFLDGQIKSLIENATKFTLHWLDDHSTDGTRDALRRICQRSGIQLREWHRGTREGVPGAFFSLLEAADADVYLFCDQDDIWEPGKIDATVGHLIAELRSPALCFSDPYVLQESMVGSRRRILEVLGTTPEIAMEESRTFLPAIGYGHTQGFTRSLKELFMRHTHIARAHAFMHDVWMYALAVACGTVNILRDSPTTLYRRHAANVSGDILDVTDGALHRITMTRQQIQRIRRGVSRHADGFIKAAPTLPQSVKLDRLLEVAHFLSALDRRQSLSEVVRLFRRRVLWPNRRLSLQLATACLVSHANAKAQRT